MLSENASITGKPATVFTENKDPDSESVTENNCPEEPSIENTVDPDLVMDTEPVTPSDPVIKAEPVYGKVVSGAQEADLAQLEVPNNEPVKPFKDATDPVKLVDPETIRDPVIFTVVPL